MPLRKRLKPLALLPLIACGLPARPAQAGPLIDWLFGHHRRPAPAYAVGYPYAVGMPVVAGYAPVVAGYAPAVPVMPSYTTGYTPSYTTGYAPSVGYSALRPSMAAIAPAAVIPPPTAPVSVIPDYRTSVSRTPVTYYRPLLTTDATTGSQVVAMAPCSSYEYQTQRVPTLGSTQLYYGGASLPATSAVAPAVSPTVVLPPGGVALAGPAMGTQPYGTAYGTYPQSSAVIAPAAPTVSAIAPSVPAYATAPSTPYGAGYSAYASNPANYSALQPPVAAAPGAVYPTAPSGGSTGSPSTAYYGGSTGSAGTAYYGSASNGGGSTGSYGVPGQPMTTIPGTSQVPYGTNPGVPSTGVPVQPGYPGGGSVFPPGSAPSTDPAAGQQPTLPFSGTGASLQSKPQLQSVVQQPMQGTRSTTHSHSSAPARDNQNTGKLGPGLLPIPVPDDFKHEPRWNPGLLNEQDQTAAYSGGGQDVALVAANADPSVAWGSKTIHWASFKEPVESAPLREPTRLSESSGLEQSAGPQFSTPQTPQSGLRDIRRSTQASTDAAHKPIVQPKDEATGASQSDAPQIVIPSHVRMVPLQEALRAAPAAGAAPTVASPALAPDAGGHLMLSPSSGQLLIEAVPSSVAPAASPAHRSRYSTDGWQRAR